jgi:hypothetical protein
MNIETQHCSKCGLDLPASGFNKRRNANFYAYCKPCMSVYSRNHYLANASDYKRRRRESQKRYRLRNRSYIIDYLKSHPYVDCGESDPVILEFDHIGYKEIEISNFSRRAVSIARLQAEN